MALSFNDRIKGLCRSVKMFLNPKTAYVNFVWMENNSSIDGRPNIRTHTFYESDSDPTDPLLLLIAQVAGRSKTLETVNEKAEFYLSRVCIAHKHYKLQDGGDLRFVSNPIRLFQIAQEKEKSGNCAQATEDNT